MLPVYVHAPHGGGALGAWRGSSRWWLHHSLAALEADLARQHAAPSRAATALPRCGGNGARQRCHRRGTGIGATSRPVAPAIVPSKAALREDGVVGEFQRGPAGRKPGTSPRGRVSPTACSRRSGAMRVPAWCRRRPQRRAGAASGEARRQPGPRRPWPAAAHSWDSGLAAGLDAGQCRGLALCCSASPRRPWRATRRSATSVHHRHLACRRTCTSAKSRRARSWNTCHGSAGSIRTPQAVLAAAEPFLRETRLARILLPPAVPLPAQRRGQPQPAVRRFSLGGRRSCGHRALAARPDRHPIVDAGLRELWHTSWMHNRVRMLVASLLTKRTCASTGCTARAGSGTRSWTPTGQQHPGVAVDRRHRRGRRAVLPHLQSGHAGPALRSRGAITSALGA